MFYLGPVNPFGNSKPMLHNFCETFKSWHLCYIEKQKPVIARKSCTNLWFLLWMENVLAKVLCRCKLVPDCVEPRGCQTQWGPGGRLSTKSCPKLWTFRLKFINWKHEECSWFSYILKNCLLFHLHKKYCSSQSQIEVKPQ